jgi:hypothetical protein
MFVKNWLVGYGACKFPQVAVGANGCVLVAYGGAKSANEPVEGVLEQLCANTEVNMRVKAKRQYGKVVDIIVKEQYDYQR